MQSLLLIFFHLKFRFSDFTKRNSNFGPVHPRQHRTTSNLARSIERNSIEEQDEKPESSPEGMKQLIDENGLEMGEKLAKMKGKKVNMRANGALDKNSETSTSNVNLAKIKSSSTSQLSVSGKCLVFFELPKTFRQPLDRFLDGPLDQSLDL